MRSNESDFTILRLDLKLVAHGLSNSSASLVSQLEKLLIANFLKECIGASINHIDKLWLRVEDTSSQVLVRAGLNTDIDFCERAVATGGNARRSTAMYDFVLRGARCGGE